MFVNKHFTYLTCEYLKTCGIFIFGNLWKLVAFYFHVKTKILWDFQICISVPLNLLRLPKWDDEKQIWVEKLWDEKQIKVGYMNDAMTTQPLNTKLLFTRRSEQLNLKSKRFNDISFAAFQPRNSRFCNVYFGSLQAN